ncbi:2-hydroxy-3-oxopropionate reductase [Moorellaceae bacterium AZ2]
MGKIGFIGLGIMGKPMSKNLIKAGYQLVVYNRSQAAVEELVAAGAEPASSPCEVAERSDKFITMLPNSPEVKEVVLGPKGLIEGARPGSILIDMSSIEPQVTREIAAELAGKGVRMLDAPVSGSEAKAVQGTLAIMVGGKEEDFEECYPILKALGSSVVRVGDIGAGNVAKLANQIIVALNMAAMSEALVLAAKAGVDPELVYRAIRGGLAGSAVLDMKAPMIMARNFRPGFRINLHIKDLANALAAAHDIGVPLPLTSVAMEIFQALKVDGLGEADHSAIVRFYEKMAQVEVRKQEK